MKTRARFAQALCGAAWGAFFSLAPILEILTFGAIVWLPLLLWGEWRLLRRFGFFPGFSVRVTIAASVVCLAAWAPLKHEDFHRLELSDAHMTLSDIAASVATQDVKIDVTRADAATLIVLPSERPSATQLIRAVEGSTPLRYRPAKCGNGATVLWGAFPIGPLRLE